MIVLRGPNRNGRDVMFHYTMIMCCGDNIKKKEDNSFDMFVNLFRFHSHSRPPVYNECIEYWSNYNNNNNVFVSSWYYISSEI